MFIYKCFNFQSKHIIHKTINLFHVKPSIFRKIKRSKNYMLI